MLNATRIGHFAINTELYLLEKAAGINKPKSRYLDIFFAPKPLCNRYLLKKWSEHLIILPGFLLRGIYKINSFLYRGNVFTATQESSRDIFDLLHFTDSTINFSAQERFIGDSLIEGLGIKQGAKYVTLIVRDSAYLERLMPNKDWSYHDYRDNDIDNYVLAAETLAEHGFFVVRVGSVVKKKFRTSHPRIIDYAFNGKRTDFLDLYLASNCEFCISTGTGFDALPHIFRKPCVYTNFAPLGTFPTFQEGLVIPKHYYSTRLKRRLSLKEVVDHNKAMFIVDGGKFSELGIELQENSPEEICDACLEMVEILGGTHLVTNEDQFRQERFWKNYPLSKLIDGQPLHGKLRTRIGRSYLKQFG